MLRSIMTAVLVLALGLTAAGCGSKNAGTAANRWNAGESTGSAASRWGGDQDAGNGMNRWGDAAVNDGGKTGPAATVPGIDRDEAGVSTALEGRKDGSYYADEDGRVSDFLARRDAALDRTNGQVLTDAGRSLSQGARSAARNVGDAVEEAADDAMDAARSAKNEIKTAVE